MQFIKRYFLRLNTHPKEDAMGAYFTKSTPGTIVYDIYKNNMDDVSFDLAENSIKRTIMLQKQAVFDVISNLYSKRQFACKVF